MFLRAPWLQNNLCRIVEPFSRVEIAHVAKLIKLDRSLVETKLSQMILDKKLPGILDQGSGTLEIFEVADEDKAYSAALQTIEHTSQVVEALFAKAKKLS
jgi:26S proteasome regulatory subunit N6